MLIDKYLDKHKHKKTQTQQYILDFSVCKNRKKLIINN